MNKDASDLRLQQHRSGWRLIISGKNACVLSYARQDHAFYLFSIGDLQIDRDELVRSITEGNRISRPELKLINLEDQSVIEKDEFLIGIPDENVRIRDLRPFPASGGGRLLRQFKEWIAGKSG